MPGTDSAAERQAVSHRAGAGPIHRRQRGDSADARAVPQNRRRKKIRHRRCRHERSDPPDALRSLSLHLAGQARRRQRATPRSRRFDPRTARSSMSSAPSAKAAITWPKTVRCPDATRRSAGRLHRRRVRLCHEQQLQQPPAAPEVLVDGDHSRSSAGARPTKTSSRRSGSEKFTATIFFPARVKILRIPMRLCVICTRLRNGVRLGRISTGRRGRRAGSGRPR